MKVEKVAEEILWVNIGDLGSFEAEISKFDIGNEYEHTEIVVLMTMEALKSLDSDKTVEIWCSCFDLEGEYFISSVKPGNNTKLVRFVGV
jgi:hypothetical protein